MPYTIAAIADIHAARSNPVQCPHRQSRQAETLLLRAVQRINRIIKPQVTLVLGDVLDNGGDEQAPATRRRLREILEQLHAPAIVIPGNHDGDATAFYREMPRPAAVIDIDGVRFLPFIDLDEPDFHARRTAADLARMTAARAGFTGPIISLQHVPLLPPGSGASPYRFTNAAQVVAAMHAADIMLAISGHYHEGEPLIQQDKRAFVVVAALCEAPFSFLEVTLDGEEISVTCHALGMEEPAE